MVLFNYHSFLKLQLLFINSNKERNNFYLIIHGTYIGDDYAFNKILINIRFRKRR